MTRRSGYVRSGSGFARVRGRRGTISGSKALGILRRSTPGSRTRSGYPSVYSTLTPLGKAAYWATRGMSPTTRGATISAIEKSYRAPETLTARERELIRPHLEQFPEEFKRKFYQAERKVQQAKMETKVTKMKESLQPQELKQKRLGDALTRTFATTIAPGAATALKMGSVWGQGSVVATALRMGITPTTLKTTEWWLKKSPFAKVGERIGIEATKVKRWITGEVPAAQQAIVTMLPSYAATAEIYKGDVSTFKAKWKPYIKGEEFIGGESKYQEYMGEFKDIERRGKQLDIQYGAFGQLEEQVEREEREKFWGAAAVYEKYKKKTSKWITARTPTTEQILAPTKDAQTQKDIERTYSTYRKLFGMSTKPLAIEEKAGMLGYEYKKGVYEEFREDPLKTAVTTAAFLALPSVLKGAKYVGKAVRFAPAAKYVRPFGIALKKGKKITYPGLITKEPVKVGVEKGILHSSARFIPKGLGYGMGATYAGALGYEMYVTPPSERAYKLGRMTTTEFLPMAIGTYVGVKAPAMISRGARAARVIPLRKKLKMEELTPEQIASGKQEILYIEKDVRPSEYLKSIPEIQRQYGIPSEPTREVKLWKAMPYKWGKETVIRRGHFEVPGGYASPELQPFFFRIGRKKPAWALFGTEFPTPEIGVRPTAMRISLKDIARLPRKVRETRDPYSMTAYALGKGEVGKAYVSWPIELGTKLESELVIAPTTGMKWTPSPTGKKYYTTWKWHVAPIEHYKWYETKLPRPEIGFEAGKYFVKRPRATAIIETKKGIVLHPGERGEGLILPGGGIETAAEVAAKRGVRVVSEKAAEAAMREAHEEFGVITTRISKRLFTYKSEKIPVYSRGRQKWYSKTYHDVFAIDIKGKPKPVSREVSKVVYWTPESKMKLSPDTEAILKEYMAAKKRGIVSKEIVTKERMQKVVSELKQRKERIQKGEPKTFEELLKHQQLEYEEYISAQQRAALLSPSGLGIEYGIKKVAHGLSYAPTGYKEIISEIAYPKYLWGMKYYAPKPIREAYPGGKPMPYPKSAKYPEAKPTPYPKPMKYPGPKPTPYPKPTKYPGPKPTPYPKPMKYPGPKPRPKPTPYPKQQPVPKPEIVPVPEIIPYGFEIPEKKPRKRPLAKKKPYAWKVRNPIPELQEMFSKEMQKRRIV